MKRFTFIICALILTLAGSVYAKGKPGGGGTCADVPISWEFLGDGSGLEAILSDGSGIYMDGNGVSNSRIHSAGTCAGDFGHSKDATIAFSSPRSLRFKIDGEIPGSLISGQGGPAQYGPTPFPTMANSTSATSWALERLRQVSQPPITRKLPVLFCSGWQEICVGIDA